MLRYHLPVILLIIAGIIYVYYFWPFLYADNLEWLNRFLLFELTHRMNGSLFLLPLLYIAAFVRWPAFLLWWFIFVVAAVPRMLSMTYDNASLLQNLSYASVPMLVLVFITLELNWRNKERRILSEIEQERQSFTSQILRTQEAERKSLAQELHDDTLQGLIATASRMQIILESEKVKVDAEIRREANWVRDVLLDIADNVRRLSIDLRPSVLDNLGLVPAVRWLGENINEKTGIHAEVEVHGQARALGSDTDVVVFRLIQEALNNVKRHSQATKAIVKLKFTDDGLEVSVEDDGKGFVIPQASELVSVRKMGLIGMQERAKAIGGDLQIESMPGHGTKIVVGISSPQSSKPSPASSQSFISKPFQPPRAP